MPNPQAPNSAWSKWLGIIVCVFAILPVSLDVNVESRITYQLVVTILLGLWLARRASRASGLPSIPLNWPLLGLWLAYALATLLAPDMRFSLEGLWLLGIHILLVSFLVDAMRSRGARLVFEPVFFASAVVILVGLFEVIAWYFGIPFPTPQPGWAQIGGLSQPIPPYMLRVASTLGRSTLLSAYLGTLIPVGLAWGLSTNVRQTRIGLAFWVAGALVVEGLSFSRGGLLSLAVSLPILSALLATGGAGGLKQVSARLKSWQVVVGLVALGIVVGGLIWGWLTQDMAGHISGDQQRLDLWRSAWEIGLDHPLSGVGPLEFGRALHDYRNPLITADHFTSPHNALLHVWAEAGVLGIAALLAVLATLVVSAYHRWRTANGIEKARVAGAIAALAGFAAHNMVDTFLASPILLPGLVLIAYIMVPFGREGGAVRGRRFAPATVLAALTLSAVSWAIADAAQWQLARALRLAQEDELDIAVDSLDVAIQLDPALGIYRAQRAQYLGVLAARDDAYLDTVLAAYSDALANNDSYDLMVANMGMLRATAGDLDGALVAMTRASRLQPSDPHYVLWIGDLRAAQGDASGTVDAYRMALELQPSWVASSYWDATPLRVEARQRFLESLRLDDTLVEMLGEMWPFCWPDGDTLRAYDSLVPSEGQLAYCDAEAEYFLEGNSRDALDALEQAVRDDPSFSMSYILRARIYLEHGDLDRAERDARIAVFLQDGHGYTILGQVAEARGDASNAEQAYLLGGPVIVRYQGWEIALYGRRGDFSLLPIFDAPGPSRYDFASWVALIELYQRQGRSADAQAVRDAILRLDPYFPTIP